MRKLWFAAALAAGLTLAGPASAQRVWQNGRWIVMPQRTAPTVMPVRGNRWPMVNGRWSAGWKAPGGWGAYHRLNRGQRLPGYWMGGGYRIDDYLSFGLAAPPPGYFWTRYYDDAVLADARGDVWDSVGGISWVGDTAYADGGYSHSESYAGAGTGAGYHQPILPVDPTGYYDRQDGVGPIPYPGDYAPPPPPPPPPPAYAPPPPVVHVQPGYEGGAYQHGTFYGGNAYHGGTTTYYSTGGYGYAAGGGTTTVVITPAPTVTTTVIEEEVIEEKVVRTSYVRPKPRRVVRRAPVRKKPKCCVCVCR